MAEWRWQWTTKLYRCIFKSRCLVQVCARQYLLRSTTCVSGRTYRKDCSNSHQERRSYPADAPLADVLDAPFADVLHASLADCLDAALINRLDASLVDRLDAALADILDAAFVDRLDAAVARVLDAVLGEQPYCGT